MVRTIQPHLYSTHEEADSKIIFYVTNIEENSNVVIRTADTDVLTIPLGCISQIPPNVNLWLEVGLYSKNTLPYINVNKFSNLFQLTMLLQVATIPFLFLGKIKSTPLHTSKRMKLCKKYLVAWVSMKKRVKKLLVQLSIMFVPYMENQS